MNVTLDRLVEFVGNHWIMSSGLFIVAILLIQDLVEGFFRKYKTISPGEVVTLMNDDGTVVLDVRDASEFADGHIEGARHVPVGKVEERAYDLNDAKESPVVVYCQSGTRSPQACKKLVSLGFTRVHEMRGGLLSWEDQNLPVTRKRSKK